VTRRGKIVAKLVPTPVAGASGDPPEWPDFLGRMRKLFPKAAPRGKPTSELIYEMRRERF
jgi:hypothetical protein